MTHERAPESLAKEIWFYSLERRAQSATLRRLAIVLAAVAVLLLLGTAIQAYLIAGAVAAAAAAVTLEVAGVLRGGRQRAAILAQLHAGANPQLVDATGAAPSNRTVILVAVAVAIVGGLVSVLVIGQLS